MLDRQGRYGGPAEPLAHEAAPGPEHGVRAVVFDLDGVLVDSFEVMREAFSVAYAEVVGAGEAPFAEYNRHLGRYFPDIMRIMGLPPEMEEPFVRESRRLASRVQVFEGIPELLDSLHRSGVPMAVATGKAGERARALLARLGLLDRFEVVIGSDEVVRPKPAPDMVRLAASVLGARPGQTMMVGDAVTDLHSAHGAGVRAAAALWAGVDPEPLLREAPDVVLRSPAELLEHVATPVAAP
ncbi:Pyrophosphatase PpaX [Streptomyces sp. enrichment culture]|uniref:HAD-IA family hydrolase n=1 Tax=Streptomyces sp. enrichment culture TaxID=1795815 RepID=UPI003F560F93